jgi:hypothetical protein
LLSSFQAILFSRWRGGWMSFFFNLFQAPSALEMAPTALETIGF